MDYLSIISKATQFIHNNHDENILVSDIAEYVYLSPSYFSTVFRILTGYSVKEYVNLYRLYRAAIELKETDIDYNIGTNNIGDLYDLWNSQNLIDIIPDQVNYSVVYGMTHESGEDDTAKYMIGVEVSTLDNLPSGFIARRFDTCEYAVFETTLAMVASGDFWKYFFKTWLHEQSLEQPQTVHTKNNYVYSRLPNFEVYDADFKDLSSRIQIYAPILMK